MAQDRAIEKLAKEITLFSGCYCRNCVETLLLGTTDPEDREEILRQIAMHLSEQVREQHLKIDQLEEEIERVRELT